VTSEYLGPEESGTADPDIDVLTIELDEEASDLEKVRHAVGASEADDPLRALLAVDVAAPLEDVWYSKRLKTNFTLRGFRDDKEYEQIVERATRYVKRRGGGRQREVDGRRLSRLLVMEGVVAPPLSAKHGREGYEALLQKYGALDSEELIGKALLPGEVDQIAEKIMELSGFDDDLEVVAGN
jgi:hypothetical protein